MRIVIEGKHVQDCENANRYYIELPDGWRIIFEDEEYAGCYYAGEEDNVYLDSKESISAATKAVFNEVRNVMSESKDKDETKSLVVKVTAPDPKDMSDLTKEMTRKLIDEIANNMEEVLGLDAELLKLKTMATDQDDGTTVIVANEFPINPVLKDDPMSKYFTGDDVEWFTKHHYAHPEQCAILAKFYRNYKPNQNNENLHDALCIDKPCVNCILNDHIGLCRRKLNLGSATYGQYTRNQLHIRLLDVFEEDRMVQDKYGDYYDPRKWYAGKGGIVCAGDCYHVKNIRKENRREFDTLAEALTVGRCRECKHCHGHHKK